MGNGGCATAQIPPLPEKISPEKTFRGRMAAARASAKLSQKALADLLGKQQSYVSSVESGDKRIDVIEYLRWMQVVGAPTEEALRYLEELDSTMRLPKVLDAAVGGTLRRRLKPDDEVQVKRPTRKRTKLLD
jgi:transcriptional regulator with XRE-family HTH domain